MAKKDKVETGVAVAVPAYLQGNGPVDLEDNFDSSDIIIPRIQLLQGMSDAVKEYGLPPGSFFHTGIEEVVPDMDFVIVARQKRYMLVAPMEDGRGVLARAEDAKYWDCLLYTSDAADE